MARVVLIGDNEGVPQLLRHTPVADVVGVVGASNRPAYHDDLRAVAAVNGVPFFVQPLRRNDDYGAFLRAMEHLSPDVLLVNSYSQILHPDLLAVPRHGSYNIHAAPLPRYRGSNPIQWAIINDERSTGVTLHQMSAAVDQGPIVAQIEVPIYFEDTWQDVRARAYAASDDLLAANLANVVSGDARATIQDEARASVMPRRTPEDGLFSWDWPVIDVYNHIRALTAPLPGAFAYEKDVRHPYAQFCSIQEVFQHAANRRMFRYGDITIAPASAPGRLNEIAVVATDLEAAPTACHFRLDWRSKVAVVSAVEDSAVLRAVQEFCAEELRLETGDQ